MGSDLVGSLWETNIGICVVLDVSGFYNDTPSLQRIQMFWLSGSNKGMYDGATINFFSYAGNNAMLLSKAANNT